MTFSVGQEVIVYTVIEAVIADKRADGSVYATWGDNNRQRYTVEQQRAGVIKAKTVKDS